MIPELSGPCSAVSVPYCQYWYTEISRLCLLSVMKYGIIVLGNSSNAKRVCTLQKKIITIMASAEPRNLFRRLFKKTGMLPVPCEYIST
jgi:hypothetical protein